MPTENLTNALFTQWQHTFQPFGVNQALSEQTFTKLVQAYSQSHRHYHTLKHVHHVLSTINTLHTYTKDLAAVQLAAWFHDVVYDTQAQDNEEKSANYACKLLNDLGIHLSTISSVNRIILNTKHHQAAADDCDSQVLLDADLAILAANPAQYQAYIKAIRQEYAWVSELEYIAGRRQVLEKFWQRSHIYFTALMFEFAELSARHNIQAEIQGLIRNS